MLNTMVEQKALSGAEIAELYEILRRAEEAQQNVEDSSAVPGKDGERI